MIKGIDLLTHPDAEEIIIYEGTDINEANIFYDLLLNDFIYNFKTNKRYRILEKYYERKLIGKYVVYFIGELISE